MTRSRLRPLDLSAAPEGSAETPATSDAHAATSDGLVVDQPDNLAADTAEDLGFAQNAYTVALAAGLVWAISLSAYTLFDRAGGARPGGGLLWLLVFGGVVAMPIAFMLLAAYAIRQGARLALETRRARAMAGELIGPAAVAAAGAGDALEAVRIEIAHAAEAASEAGRTVGLLRETLAAETQELTRTAAEANRATGRLTAAFRRERDGMTELAVTLDAATQSASAAMAEQSSLVTQAADRARARSEEARGEIAAQAAELAAAMDGAVEAALAASQTLAGQTDRLERAGAFLGERYRGLEASLADRHQAVLGLTDVLREEQEHAAVLLEQQRSTLAQAATDARVGAEGVASAVEEAAARLQALQGWSEDQTRAVANAAQAHHERLQEQARHDFAALETAVAAGREAAELESGRAIDRIAAGTASALAAAREAAEQTEAQAASQVRAQSASLDEAARSAEARVRTAAQGMVGEFARALEAAAAQAEAAGARSAVRVEAGSEGARSALADIEAMLTELEQRIGDLPARARAEADAAMLSVQAVAAATDAARARAAAAAEPFAPAALPLDRQPEATNGSTREVQTAAPPSPAPASTRAAAPVTDALGLRPRLKLTPAGATEPSTADEHTGRDDPDGPILFDRTIRAPASLQPPQPAPKRDLDDWTWKDLLNDVEDEPSRDEDSLAEGLRAEIQAMGVDAGVLLPTPRIDEIAAALHSGDPAGARDLVSRSAPAAIRRLSRRVLTDTVLRAQADRHVKHYQHLVSDAAKRDLEGHMTSALLSSEPGRTYLLLDAAFRELH